MRLAMTAKYQVFADRLDEAMRGRGVTSSKLAKEVGVTYESVRRYLDGVSMPRESNLERLGQALGVNAAWLRDDRFAVKLSDSESKANPESNVPTTSIATLSSDVSSVTITITVTANTPQQVEKLLSKINSLLA
jgi:transcriptional regulator with XRE-family HTH domain